MIDEESSTTELFRGGWVGSGELFVDSGTVDFGVLQEGLSTIVEFFLMVRSIDLSAFEDRAIAPTDSSNKDRITDEAPS